ncbi:uncharacterized protein [Sinocyclocheilus grahami]|uniref:uncharacterized protein n=1 Tax=Sinocyclocheilus grahami TaxID=75366 RepID=UPI0007AC6EFB|nr:PREDICTED: uncharacterized protein LOC107548492 [Sinocyclocheilus grahami]
MKILLYVCFILFVTTEATGQTPDPCNNVINFNQCLNGGAICDEKISRCICFEGQPFCRCNSQKVVYVLMLPSNKSHAREGMTTSKTASKEQDLFPGVAFASDMNGQPPLNMRPVQQGHIPMTAMPISSGMRDPQMGGPGRPYSMYTGMRDPPMGGPVQPYSNGAVRGQIVSNPYARDSSSRNPYEEHSPSADHHSDYRPHVPSHTYDDLKHNQPYSPALLYGSSEHGNLRNGFPRPQLSLRY